MKSSHILFLFLTFFSFSFAQKSEIKRIEKQGKITLSELPPSWNAQVYSTEAIFPGSASYRSYIHQLKLLHYGDAARISTPATFSKTNQSAAPIVSAGFAANDYGGIPNDNDLAISNDGKIVSVTNSSLYVFDESGTNLGDFALQNFADSLGLTGNSYDPKVLYDPNEDKFILVFLNGNDATETSIVVAFSQSNDPLQEWNLYFLAGNPFNDNAWTDFPMIAITEQDFFVTGNLINSDSASWQTGFMQSVIWQVDKESGFNGGTLLSKVHGDIKYDGKNIRNLRPVKGGFSIKSDEMYFISNKNFDLASDTFFIVKITESLSQNQNVSFTTEAIKATTNYGLPPDAKQVNNTFFQTNDSRPLGAIIENGIIHIVGNTVNETTNLASIYHGKINTLASNKTVDLSILSDTALEYGYPNISFSGQSPFDEQAIISFNHTSLDSFPGMSAIFYDKADGYSSRKHLVSGNSFVNVIGGSFERWGDYSGSQKRYNAPGEVWISGFVGLFNSIFPRNRHHTYVFKLNTADTLFSSINSPLAELKPLLYPNPTRSNQFTLSFSIEEAATINFSVYTNTGQLVTKLIQKQVKAGNNSLTFSLNQLGNGLYFIKATAQNGNLIFTEKLLKQ